MNDRIAAETKVLHERNNRLASLKMVMALRTGETWREYVRTFYWLFLCFEEEARKVRETGSSRLAKAFETVHDPLLLRTQKIREDLEFYYGGDESIYKDCGSAEGKAYIAHIHHITETSPVRLMAYLSVMYLGLFAGGQIIRSKIVKRTGFYPAKPGMTHADVVEHGTNIFQFDTPDTIHLKKTYRARFDRVCLEYLTDQERDEVCAEAKEIFIRNERLIASVDVHSTFVLVLKTFQKPLLAILVLALAVLCFCLVPGATPSRSIA